jgi:hypothetical protein
MPWKVDTMSLKFPLPKSAFQAFKSVFSPRSMSRPEPDVSGDARFPFASDLPRRAPSQSAWQSAAPPRHAAPRRPTGIPTHGGTQSSQPGTARPRTQGDKLLATLTLRHLDRMTNLQLAEVAVFLEGRHREPGAVEKLAQFALPFMQNWQLLRSSFDDNELRTLIAARPLEILAMLKRPAPSAKPRTSQGARPRPQQAGSPAPAPGGRHQWNQTPPKASASVAQPQAKANKAPISVLQLGRQAAVAELKARGVSPAELRAMSQAFSDYANFGGEKAAADFESAFGHLVADDITDSANIAKLALFFKGLAREERTT